MGKKTNNIFLLVIMALFSRMARQEQVKLIQWREGRNLFTRGALYLVHLNMYSAQSKELQEFNFVYVQVT